MELSELLACARLDPTSQVDWWRVQDRPAGVTGLNLAGVARRIVDQDDPQLAVRDFLDSFARDPTAVLIAARPERCGDVRWDAYLGALAEHLAARHELARPDWCVEPDRFLHRFWFVSDVAGFRAISIAQAPVAFKRRGVMVPARSLERV